MRFLRRPARAFAALAIALSALFFSIPMVFAEAPVPIPVPYIDASGATQTAADYTVVTANMQELTAGWYVVDASVELAGPLTVTGEVNLVLADGCTLTAPAGVSIAEYSKLRLLPQGGQTGRLVAKGSGICALGADGVAGTLEVPVCVELTSEDGTRISDAAHTPQVSTAVTSRAYVAVRPLASHSLDAASAGEKTYYVCQSCGDLFGDEAAATRLTEVPVAEEEPEAAAASEPAQAQEAAPNVNAAADEQTVTVTFDANGGTGTMDPMEVSVDVAFVLPENAFTAPAGKEFDRWNLGTPGSSVSVSAPTTIVAQWKDRAQSIPTTTDSDDSNGSGTPAQANRTSGSPDTADVSVANIALAAALVAGMAFIGLGTRVVTRRQ